MAIKILPLVVCELENPYTRIKTDLSITFIAHRLSQKPSEAERSRSGSAALKYSESSVHTAKTQSQVNFPFPLAL